MNTETGGRDPDRLFRAWPGARAAGADAAARFSGRAPLARGSVIWPFSPWRDERVAPGSYRSDDNADSRTGHTPEEQMDQWENEGGATVHREPTLAQGAPGREEDYEGVRVRSDSLDKREDELMAVESIDGRPPARSLASAEWKWLAIFVVLVAVGALVWIVMDGMDATTLAAWGALMFIYGVAAAPIWGSLLFRARERRDAHEEALAERHIRIEHKSDE